MQYFLDYLKKNFVYFIAILAIIFALFVLIYSQIKPKPIIIPPPIPIFSPPPSAQPSITATPTSIPTSIPAVSRPVPGEQYQTISTNDREQIRRDSLVGQLLNKLPYTGTNFSLEYNYSRNQFIVTLKAGQEDAGNKELDAFLLANQIDSESWLNNLAIQIQ